MKSFDNAENPTDSWIASVLLDDVYYNIIEFLKNEDQPFKVSKLQENLSYNKIELEESSIIKRLTQLQKLRWLRRAKGKYIHNCWLPFSSVFYDRRLSQRESMKKTIAEMRKDMEITEIIPVARELYEKMRTTPKDDRRMPKLQSRMRPHVALLLKNFQVLDNVLKIELLRWAYYCDYFETLSYM